MPVVGPDISPDPSFYPTADPWPYRHPYWLFLPWGGTDINPETGLTTSVPLRPDLREPRGVHTNHGRVCPYCLPKAPS